MSEEVDSPVQVRRHIWESLVSMLRVYAHAASLTQAMRRRLPALPKQLGEPGDLGTAPLFRPWPGAWLLENKPARTGSGEFEIDDEGRLVLPRAPRNWM